MIRTQVFLTEEQQEQIRYLASVESVSAVAVIRRLIDYGLVETERARIRVAAERMRDYYTGGVGDTDDDLFREIDPWSPDEAG